ncbi:MAG: NUDIX hydrolase [Spirochaetes bacterium]|nr:NUDIX hydrolase [Spirochaetota bacterium]
MKKREYPKVPLVGVGALVLKGDEVLLVKRGRPPLEGAWSLPGGRCREDEKLKAAAFREIKEECGIDIEVADLLKLFEYIERDVEGRVKYHYVVFDFKAYYKGGRLEHSSDASDARWIPIRELDRYELSDAVLDVVKTAFTHR